MKVPIHLMGDLVGGETLEPPIIGPLIPLLRQRLFAARAFEDEGHASAARPAPHLQQSP